MPSSISPSPVRFGTTIAVKKPAQRQDVSDTDREFYGIMGDMISPEEQRPTGASEVSQEINSIIKKELNATQIDADKNAIRFENNWSKENGSVQYFLTDVGPSASEYLQGVEATALWRAINKIEAKTEEWKRNHGISVSVEQAKSVLQSTINQIISPTSSYGGDPKTHAKYPDMIELDFTA